MALFPVRSARQQFRGFTLIELLVVLAILGLLATVVAPNVIGRMGGAKMKTAQVQIADLGAALDIYRLEIGRYPTTAEGLNALIIAPANTKGWNGPYLKKAKLPDDPWGATYQYKSPGDHGDYDLYSFGADGRQGGSGDGQDIVSW